LASATSAPATQAPDPLLHGSQQQSADEAVPADASNIADMHKKLETRFTVEFLYLGVFGG
jgi:hypothetical protein